MKPVKFGGAKENHFYARRNEQGLLEVVGEPVMGEEYYELAIIAGGLR